MKRVLRIKGDALEVGTQSIGLRSITGWEFGRRVAVFRAGETEFVERVGREGVARLRSEFNAWRVAEFLREGGDGTSLRVCPNCSCQFNGSDGPTSFCSECWAVVDDERSLNHSRGGLFNFSDAGLFERVAPSGPGGGPGDGAFVSFKRYIAPLRDKVVGHLLWLVGSLFVIRYWVGGYVMAFAALLFASSYLVLLGFRGAFRFPRINGKDHPGLLANRAVESFSRNEPEAGWAHLTHALARCPNHPALIRIALNHAYIDDRPKWEFLLEKVESHNQLRV